MSAARPRFSAGCWCGCMRVVRSDKPRASWFFSIGCFYRWGKSGHRARYGQGSLRWRGAVGRELQDQKRSAERDDRLMRLAA